MIESKLPRSVYPGQLIAPTFHAEEDSNGRNIIYKFVSGNGTTVQKYKIDGSEIQVLTSTLLGNVKVEKLVNGRDDNNNNDGGDEQDRDVDASAGVGAGTGTNAAEGASGSDGKDIEIYTVSVTKEQEEVQTGIRVDADFANHLPKEGDIVLVKVMKITLQRANVEILAVENNASPVDSGTGSRGSNFLTPGGGSPNFSVSRGSSELGETFKGIIRSQDVRATERDKVKMLEAFKPGDIVRAQVLSLGDGMNYYLTTARNDLGVVFAKSHNGAGSLMYALDWQTMVAPRTGTTEKRKCAKPFI